MIEQTATVPETVLDDECPCEYGHFGVAPCTLAVTHRVAGCTPGAFNVCEAATGVIMGRLLRDQCPDCDRRAADCWTLRPA